MALIDFKERSITLKLVYCGPPRSGKTTNLEFLHSRVEPLNRGRLMVLDSRDDRTLFFDLLPIFFRASSLSFRAKVYTVPGQPMHEATRRVVLRQADGVAFIADSQADAGAANADAYRSLEANVSELELDNGDGIPIPIVVQYNKRDLPGGVPDDGLVPFAAGQSVFPAAASQGRGVLEAFFGLLDATWTTLDARAEISRAFDVTKAQFLDAFREHIASECP